MKLHLRGLWKQHWSGGMISFPFFALLTGVFVTVAANVEAGTGWLPLVLWLGAFTVVSYCWCQFVDWRESRVQVRAKREQDTPGLARPPDRNQYLVKVNDREVFRGSSKDASYVYWAAQLENSRLCDTSKKGILYVLETPEGIQVADLPHPSPSGNPMTAQYWSPLPS